MNEILEYALLLTCLFLQSGVLLYSIHVLSETIRTLRELVVTKKEVK